MAYVEVPSTDLDALSGIVESTMTTIGTNIIDHETRIGDLESYMGGEIWTAKTSDYTLTSADVNGNYGFSNNGASGTVYFTLPAALAGMRVVIANVEAQIIFITADGTDLIWIQEGQGDGSPEITNSDQGSVIILWCAVAGEWYGISDYTWTAAGQALFVGGRASGGGAYDNVTTIMDIATDGSTSDWGNLVESQGHTGLVSSGTRVVRAGGESGPVGTIDYKEWATAAASNFTDSTFDLSSARGGLASGGSSTRGVFCGGNTGSDTQLVDYITIASLSNATSAGNLLSNARQKFGALSNGTRIVVGGGNGPLDTIEWMTIASLSAATDKGNLSTSREGVAGAGNSTVGVFVGGSTGSLTQTIDSLTIASGTGVTDQGELLTVARGWLGGTCNETKALFAGGYSTLPSTASNVIDDMIFSNFSATSDFGDLPNAREGVSGTSTAHGGLNG